MGIRIITLLTEGDHDAAFIYRILKANGFAKYSKLIKEFPHPLNKLLSSDVLNISIPEESLQNARTRFLPSNVLISGDNLLLIYAVQGDSRGDKRIKLIEAFNILNTPNQNEIQAMENSSVASLYFLDADDKGVDTRLGEINNELGNIFPDAHLTPIVENASVQLFEDVFVGAYIFTKEGEATGKLEDILLPMMEHGNEDIFQRATEFLSIHESTALYQGKVSYKDNAIHKVYGERYHPKKSLIGTVGQLEKSGKSNTVCISDSNFLNDQKLLASDTCASILSFIQLAMI